MAKAVGLPNTKRDRDAVFVRNIAKLTKPLLKKKYATIADDNGAMGAWIDDSGKYRVAAYRHRVTINSEILPTLKAVKNWWKTWRQNIGTRANSEVG